MKSEDFRDILYEKGPEEGVVMVTINRPERKNALSWYSFLELCWAADLFKKDGTAHVMIMTGAKDPKNDDPAKEAFSSGAYFNPNVTEDLPEHLRDQLDPTDITQKRLVEKMWYLDKPVIAAVNGLMIGAGFTMVLSCCDLVYMSEHAWGRLPFGRVGLLPELASTFILPRLIGLQRTKEIVFFGEDISAEKAYELGLINKVVPHDDLLPCALEAARKLFPPHGPGMAIRVAKRTIHRQLDGDIQRALDAENVGLNQAIRSEDFLEAITARLEKRKPLFRGR